MDNQTVKKKERHVSYTCLLVAIGGFLAAALLIAILAVVVAGMVTPETVYGLLD